MSRESKAAGKITGTVEAIYTAPSAGEPMQPLSEADAIAGRGLAGDRYLEGAGYYSNRPLADGSREITLIEAEELEGLERETGIRLDPSESRRNILTRSVSVNALIGKRFWLGGVLCEGLRICEPCTYLEKLNGKRVMRPLVHKGGLRARIVSGGTVRVGDEVQDSPENPVEDAEAVEADVHRPNTKAPANTDREEIQAEGILRKLKSSSSAGGTHYLEDDDTGAIEYVLVSEDLELDDFLEIRVVALDYPDDVASGRGDGPGLMRTFLISAV